MKRMFFLIIGLLVLPSFAWAGDFALSGYTEIGKRSTAEDYEEEDTDSDYCYQNYHLKLEQEVSDRLSYDISTFVYDKDYRSSDTLDNISRLFKLNSTYFLKESKEESLEFDFKLKYKQKRYKNSTSNEYDELRAAPTVSFKEKDLYGIDLSLGIDNFDYLAEGEKDQFKLFTKLGAERYFLGKNLRLISSYRIENTEQEKIDRKRTKQEVLGGSDYLFNLPWIYKFISRLEWGQRDTKEEEERDEDYDYEYWRYYTKTEHRLSPKIKTALKYQYFKKDYISADLDHRGFYVSNDWDYEILDDEKQRLGFDFGLQYKDVKYELKSGNDYEKETVEAKLSYKRKKNWQASAGLEQNFYDFDDSSNDKKRTYVKLSGEKLFLEGDLVLSMDFKYRYTDYKQGNDKDQEAVRLTFKYRF
jgi:hypothetical protein